MFVVKEVLVKRKKGTVILENIGNDKVRFTENRKLIATIPLAKAISLYHALIRAGWQVS